MFIEKLPPELLGCIFSYVNSVYDLAQCRLVCKHWDYPAERAMFTKCIVVKKESTAKALHYHLKKNKELGKLIKSLDFGVLKDIVDERIKLLPLVFTPAIESIHGAITKPGFYEHLIGIAKASDVPFNNLKSIPIPLLVVNVNSYSTKNYSEALFFFRETLQHINTPFVNTKYFDPWNLFSRLDEFISLKSLGINCAVSSIQALDRMLINGTRLQRLYLRNIFMGDEMEEKDLAAWMKHHVKKVLTLTNVSIRGRERADIKRYLMYKYPNLTEASVIFE